MRPSPDAGGAGISARTLGTISFANFAEVLSELRGQKLLTTKIAEKAAKGGNKSSLAAAAWVCPKATAVGNSIHYRACGRRKGFITLNNSPRNLLAM
jgi:hypothetical protein